MGTITANIGGDTPFRRLLRKHRFGFFAAPDTQRPLPAGQPVVKCVLLRNGRDIRLIEPVVFIDPEGRTWRADAGRTVNGLSVPRFFWRIQPPLTGKAREASVIHDVLCVDCPVSSRYAHWVFYCAMRANGVGPIEAFDRWAAVRMFGPRFKGPI